MYVHIHTSQYLLSHCISVFPASIIFVIPFTVLYVTCGMILCTENSFWQDVIHCRIEAVRISFLEIYSWLNAHYVAKLGLMPFSYVT
jgi:hypothetical protein